MRYNNLQTTWQAEKHEPCMKSLPSISMAMHNSDGKPLMAAIRLYRISGSPHECLAMQHFQKEMSLVSFNLSKWATNKWAIGCLALSVPAIDAPGLQKLISQSMTVLN